MKKKLYKLLLVFLLCQLQVVAQTEGFNYEAAIQPVDSSGFYNIRLFPMLNAYLQPDFSDLRIADDSGKWVPHIIRVMNNEAVKDVSVAEKKILKKVHTEQSSKFILLNNGEDVSNLIFTVKNTTTKRYCTLSGSDDQNEWFVINDSIEIEIERTDEKNAGRFLLLFPTVDYKYLKVVIGNNGKEPVAVLRVHSEEVIQLSKQGRHFAPMKNPDPAIFQKDSGNVTFIRINQSAPYHFDRIRFEVSGVKYFKRQAGLYVQSSANHSFSNPGKLIQTFTISNNSTLQFKVPKSKALIMYVLIYNDDNLPLKVTGINTYADYSVATVYLEKSKRYRLLLNNPQISAPRYDLSLSDIPLPENISLVHTEVIIPIKKPVLEHQQPLSSHSLIWILITIATAVLAFFTYRLVTDMNRSKA